MKIKCWKCGGEATTTLTFKYDDCFGGCTLRQVSDTVRSYCDKCAREVEAKDKEERELYIKLRKREMFKKAVGNLEKQDTNMYKYKEAIEVVEEYLEKNPDKFDSSYEVLAAIVLVHNRIYSKMQYKIGRYQVDFLLPELLVVLEIDGERHKNRKGYDTSRDIQLQKALGEGWDIIRIPTDLLDKDAKKLPEAIRKVIDHRQTGKVNWRKVYG